MSAPKYSVENPWNAPPPEPKNGLSKYRLLAPTASVRVSPLCLGTMNFGDSWEYFMGTCDKNTTFEILDFFYSNGGNFIDTSNNYQSEESEIWLGEWMSQKKNRDQMIIATKYTTAYRAGYGKDEIIINTTGNGHKSLHTSLAASLAKLQTSYIDLLYVHWWDFTCSIPELMQSLNIFIQQGKVLYLGISDTPAWIVSKCNQYARDHGLRPFSVYQGLWNAATRDFERDILPMCIDEGMGIAPWGALGQGNFKSASQRQAAENEGRKTGDASEKQIKISQALESIATKKNTEITSVALAYVRSKAPYVFPIVGGRKIEHLKGNVQALDVVLTEQEVREIEVCVEFDVGFPQNFLGMGSQSGGARKGEDVWLTKIAGVTEYVE